MAAGQLLWLAIHFASELAEGNHRTGECYRADKDAQHHLNLQKHQLVGGLGGHQCRKGGELVQRCFSGTGRHHPATLQVGTPSHENRCQAHKAVQRGHELGHFGHFNLARYVSTNGCANQHHRDQPPVAADTRTKRSEKHRDRHTHDAVPHGALGLFLITQPAQRQNKQHACRNRCGRYESLL